jgi:predicted nucleic acid-binding protein
VGAFSRLQREGVISDEQRNQTLNRLLYLAARWSEIQPVDEVIRIAERLLSAHALRSADALQLAAALLWCGERAPGRTLVTGDGSLASVAAREGFDVVRVG